jgi:hypothetical protein
VLACSIWGSPGSREYESVLFGLAPSVGVRLFGEDEVRHQPEAGVLPASTTSERTGSWLQINWDAPTSGDGMPDIRTVKGKRALRPLSY